MLQIDGNSFDEQVLKNTGLVVVDFYADWCAPCRGLTPTLLELEKSNPDVKFVKVDADASQNLSGSYAVSALPTLLFFKDGKTVQRLVGMAARDNILQIINKNR